MYYHILVLKANGEVWAWGRNTKGALGDNTITDKSSPASVVGGHSFIQVSGGLHTYGFSFGLKSDGSLWAWGENTQGNLGDNTGIHRSSPVSVVGNHSFTRVSAGRYHTAALKADGSVWCWGYNSHGALGDNTVTDKSSPVSVVGGHSFVEISAGSDRSFSRKADGTVWSWGSQNYNQGNGAGGLGDGTLSNRSSPVSIVGNHSFIQISALTGDEGDGCIGLKADGSAWVWGYNNKGQLGNNTSGAGTHTTSPVSVVGGHSFTEVSGSWYHGAGLKADGSVWTWGLGSSGQLGDNAANDRSSPVSVVGAHSFVQLTRGIQSMSARKANGEVWSWGENTYGQLGDNTVSPKSSPVAVIGTT